MKAVAGLLLIGGGVFLLIALFNGSLHFPLGNVNLGLPGLGNLFTSTTPASLQNGINPSPTTGTTGGVKNINPTVNTPKGPVVCPVGTQYDPTSGKCVNIYQGNR
jgi:hypothetical protein